MTLEELRTKANAKLSDFWDILVVKQEAYFVKHHDYFQLLTSPELPVVDGVDSDFTVRIPNDLATRTIDIEMPFTEKIPFQIWVHPWGNNNEKGYKAVVLIELPDGRRFKRTRELFDNRKLKQDYNNTPDIPVPIGDPYLVGDAPRIETSAWEEIIED